MKSGKKIVKNIRHLHRPVNTKHMKTLMKILIFCLVFPFGAMKGQAQIPVDEDTKKVTYRDVINEQGSPEQLYNRAIGWINSFYANPSDVTKIRDAENGKIVAKHRIKVCNIDENGNKTLQCEIVEYELTLEFKEGKYRYTFTDFNVNKTSKFPLERWLDKNDPQYTAVCDIYLQQLDEEVNNVIQKMKDGMKPPVIKDDNW